MQKKIHKKMTNKQTILPAEWYPQRFVQLTWPHEATDWAPYLEEITATMTEMADAITRYEDLVIASQYPEATRKALQTRLSKEQMARVRIVECETNDTWARDHGGITLLENNEVTESQNHKIAKYLDFRFNGWGEKFEAAKDNLITRELHKTGIIEGELIDNDDFVLEGGSIESDGEGTIFTTSQCLMAPHRNQPLTQEEVEEELKKRLHAERIVWLNHGNLIGDDTDGHIDTIVRVCPDNTLLYVKSTDESDEQHEDFVALEDELLALRTKDGKPYTLGALPMPHACYYDDERLPATYANFLVINGAVLVPTYDQPRLDMEACDVIAKAFPDRDIIPIDSQVIIRQHGSIHCLTMQYPDPKGREKLKVKS